MAKRIKLRKDLSEVLESFDIPEEEQKLLDERLKKKQWQFRSSAASLRIQLTAEPDVPLPGGRTKPGENLSAQFREHHFRTTDKKVAMLLYLSSAFASRRIFDVEEEFERKQEMAFNDLRALVLSDPQRAERLREELFKE